MLTVTQPWTNSGVVNLGGPGSALNGGTITNLGTIQGQGTVGAALANTTGTVEAVGGTLTLAGTLSNTAGGTLTAAVNNKLLVPAGLATNAGSVALAGGTFDNGGHALQNNGQVSGWGVLRTGGVVNNGKLEFSGTDTSVYGSVVSNIASQILISGAGRTSFYDSVDVKSGAELRVSAGSTAAFFGTVYQRTGSLFTGTGAKLYEGGLSVGASPGLGVDAGDVTFASSNFYLAEIGGVTACTAACATDDALKNSSFDKYIVAGQLTLGGTLKLVSWNGFVAQAGQSFDLLDWHSLAGGFDSIDASGLKLASGTQLDVSKLYSTGEITVAAVPEPGTLALWLAGLGVVAIRFRRNRAWAQVDARQG
jgi:hypothetical protein